MKIPLLLVALVLSLAAGEFRIFGAGLGMEKGELTGHGFRCERPGFCQLDISDRMAGKKSRLHSAVKEVDAFLDHQGRTFKLVIRTYGPPRFMEFNEVDAALLSAIKDQVGDRKGIKCGSMVENTKWGENGDIYVVDLARQKAYEMVLKKGFADELKALR